MGRGAVPLPAIRDEPSWQAPGYLEESPPGLRAAPLRSLRGQHDHHHLPKEGKRLLRSLRLHRPRFTRSINRSNGLGISERKASRMLVNALKEKVGKPELIERFIQVFRQRTLPRKRRHGTRVKKPNAGSRTVSAAS